MILRTCHLSVARSRDYPQRHSGVVQGAPCVKKEKGSISAGTVMITQGENNSAVMIDRSVVR
jgi:hypothetical protein